MTAKKPKREPAPEPRGRQIMGHYDGYDPRTGAQLLVIGQNIVLEVLWPNGEFTRDAMSIKDFVGKVNHCVVGEFWEPGNLHQLF